MISIPFIYFMSLFIIQYFKNNKKFDIACFIIVIYAISGFFSILLDRFNLRSFDTQNYEIGFIPTVLYCGLITLCLLPFLRFSSSQIIRIQPVRNVRLLKCIAWGTFLYFIFDFCMSFDGILNVLTGNISELRTSLYQGNLNEGWMDRLSPMIRAPFSFANMVLGCSWVLQLLSFFVFFVQKLPKKYFIFLLLASCRSVIHSIIGVDRSGVTFWILGFLACYILFKSSMNSRQKKQISKVSFVFLTILVLYLAFTTISRFGSSTNSEISVENSLISYLGQPFINFCFLFDNFQCPFPSLQAFFPFLSSLFLGDQWGLHTSVQAIFSAISNVELGVFYTFLGSIFITSNVYFLLLFCTLFPLISYISLSHLKSPVSFSKVYVYYLFSSVLFLGLFSHYYSNSAMTFSALSFYILIKFFFK